MARQKSIIKLKGTLQDINFYKREGEYYARENTGPDRDRILKDPKFRRTRENMSEFGAAAFLGKEFRQGWKSIVKKVGDSRLTARLTGLMRKIITNGRGPRGHRSFDVVAHKRHLEGFEFSRHLDLSDVFYANYGMPQADENRRVVTWTVPDFRLEDKMKVPAGATHFRLLLASKVFSDYEYEPIDNQYVPLNPKEAKLYGEAESDLIPLGLTLGGDVTLTVDHGGEDPLSETVAVVNAVGILFYQEVDGQPYLLESDSAMKVLNVL